MMKNFDAKKCALTINWFRDALKEEGCFSGGADREADCARKRACSARLEEKDSDLTKVEVDEMFGLVSHVGAEVTSDDTMPGGVVLFVEFLLDEGCDVLLNVVALKRLGGDVDSILLHVLSHVSILNDGFAIGHGELFK